VSRRAPLGLEAEGSSLLKVRKGHLERVLLLQLLARFSGVRGKAVSFAD